MKSPERPAPHTGLLVAGVAIAGIISLTMWLSARDTPAPSVDTRVAAGTAPVATLSVQFADRDGDVVITDGTSGELITVLSGEHGFVRSVMRGMARERRARQVPQTPPFRLMRWSDGRTTLDDPSTGRWVELDAFGPDNAGAFAAILHASRGDTRISGTTRPATEDSRRQ